MHQLFDSAEDDEVNIQSQCLYINFGRPSAVGCLRDAMSAFRSSRKQNRSRKRETDLLKVIYARFDNTVIRQFRELIHNIVQRRQLLKRRFYNLQLWLLARLIGVDLLRYFGRRLLDDVFGV